MSSSARFSSARRLNLTVMDGERSPMQIADTSSTLQQKTPSNMSQKLPFAADPTSQGTDAPRKKSKKNAVKRNGRKSTGGVDKKQKKKDKAVPPSPPQKKKKKKKKRSHPLQQKSINDFYSAVVGETPPPTSPRSVVPDFRSPTDPLNFDDDDCGSGGSGSGGTGDGFACPPAPRQRTMSRPPPIPASFGAYGDDEDFVNRGVANMALEDRMRADGDDDDDDDDDEFEGRETFSKRLKIGGSGSVSQSQSQSASQDLSQDMAFSYMTPADQTTEKPSALRQTEDLTKKRNARMSMSGRRVPMRSSSNPNQMFLVPQQRPSASSSATAAAGTRVSAVPMAPNSNPFVVTPLLSSSPSLSQQEQQDQQDEAKKKSRSRKRKSQGALHSGPLSRLETEFELVRTIGEGSFGAVLLCQRRFDGCMYAVKRVSLCLHKRDHMREVFALSALDCPHIVRYFNAWIEEDDMYIQTEHMERGDLLAQLAARGVGLPDGDLRVVCAQMARALAYLHERQTYHFDVKPANVLQNAQGALKLGDFGLARHRSHLVANDLDTSLIVLEDEGDRHYIPQEVLQDRVTFQHVDKVDVFMLGATIYHLACGPNVDDATFRRVRQGDLDLESTLMSDRLSRVIRAMVNPVAAQRPTARDVFEELAR